MAKKLQILDKCPHGGIKTTIDGRECWVTPAEFARAQQKKNPPTPSPTPAPDDDQDDDNEDPAPTAVPPKKSGGFWD